MGAPAFTPGPWQSKGDYTKGDACTIIANVDGDGHADGTTTYSYDFICTCEDEYGEFNERAEANARLIRTAPELYSILDELLCAVATTVMPEASLDRLMPIALKAKAVRDKAVRP